MCKMVAQGGNNSDFGIWMMKNNKAFYNIGPKYVGRDNYCPCPRSRGAWGGYKATGEEGPRENLNSTVAADRTSRGLVKQMLRT